jgi:hypothetical protein
LQHFAPGTRVKIQASLNPLSSTIPLDGLTATVLGKHPIGKVWTMIRLDPNDRVLNLVWPIPTVYLVRTRRRKTERRTDQLP